MNARSILRLAGFGLALTLVLLAGPAAQAKQKKKPEAPKAEAAQVAEPVPAPAPVVEPAEEILADLPNPDKACKKDIETHCAQVKYGDNRVASCLRAQKDGLSNGCKKDIYEYLKKRFEQACKADMKKLCLKESTQQGGLMPCMQKNAEKLSAACADVLGLKPAAAK
ncbi:MAG: cysteine rich repeat-containing protein [Myxococcales bacterium]|nr:cysteine rich repeat-containing protein [Myxococcales bacterium]